MCLPLLSKIAQTAASSSGVRWAHVSAAVYKLQD